VIVAQQAQALQQQALRGAWPILYNGRGFEVKAAFTLLRDLEPTRMRMSIRGNVRAIERGAGKARPGALTLANGLLLLIAP
jgi:hypothetical protein